MQQVTEWISALLVIVTILIALTLGGVLVTGMFVTVLAAIGLAAIADLVLGFFRGLSSLITRSEAKGDEERRDDR
jgi:hypothetical protein